MESDRREQHGRGRVADEHRHQRGGEIDACEQNDRPVAAQSLGELSREQLRRSRFFQRDGHRQHRRDQYDAFPVDRFVSGFHVAQAAGQHHQHGGDHHGRDRGDRDEVEHHAGDHQHHDRRG